MSNNVHNDFISTLHNHSVNPRTREIFLHGCLDSDDWSEVSFKMAVQFEKNISLLDGQNEKPIIVHIHSPGGSWDDGMAIYDMIRACKSPIVIIGHGQVYSMASVIFQAADLRLLMPHANMMIHYGTTNIDDHCVGTITQAEQTKVELDVMMDIYASRAIHGEYFTSSAKPIYDSEEKVKRYLNNRIKEKVHLYLTPSEAISYGLADNLMGGGKNEYTLTELKKGLVEVIKIDI